MNTFFPTPNDCDEPWRLTLIMDGAIEASNPPIAVLERRNLFELTAGADISEKVYRALSESRKEGRQILSAALLRTPGGYVNDGRPLLSAIGYLDREGVPTTAFVDNNAESYGARVLAACRRKITRTDSSLMWHQTYQLDSNKSVKGSEKPSLSFPRDFFRKKLRSWLEENTSPEHQHWVLERAEAAFLDPDNHLDDVEFEGWELKRAGVLDEAVKDRQALSLAYSKTMRSKPLNWPVQVKRFFS